MLWLREARQGHGQARRNDSGGSDGGRGCDKPGQGQDRARVRARVSARVKIKIRVERGLGESMRLSP